MANPQVSVVFGADSQQLRKNLSSMTKQIQAAAQRVQSVGRKLTVGLSLPLAGIGAGAIKMSTDFNAAMANVATLIPGNRDRIDSLKDSVSDLSVEVGKSVEDLSGGLFQVISAFGDTSDSVDILTISAKAATAGLSSTEEAINLVSAVTKGYGDTSKEAVQKASDLAFTTNRLGQTTFPELAASLGRVVPLSAELGVTQEELFGVMATGTGVTGKAAEVSTQFRGILQSLSAPTKDMQVLLDRLGISSGKALLQQRGLTGTIQTIVSAAKNANIPLQKYISSIEGQTLALALAGSQSDTFAQKLAEMKDVTGATDEAFREQTEGVNKLGFEMNQMRRRVERIAREIGENLAPFVSQLNMLVGKGVGSLGKPQSGESEHDYRSGAHCGGTRAHAARTWVSQPPSSPLWRF